MSRINTNISALVAQRRLGRSNSDLGLALERLSTGYRINRGADNPAGLIVSEFLRGEIEGARQAVDNSQRAINVIATAEGALTEIAALLNDIRGLVIEASNTGALSDDEIDANQRQVDSAIESITRIANTATFAGRKLINGSLDYLTSGVDQSAITDVQIEGVKFGSRTTIPVTVNVTQSAQQAQLFWSGPTAPAGGVIVDLGGPNGVVSLDFRDGATATVIVNAINVETDTTGVYAVLANASNPASGFYLRSLEYGDNAFISVAEIGSTGRFPVIDTDDNPVQYAVGRNAVATINGVASIGQGLELSLNTTTLDIRVRLDETFGAGATIFYITGGGATFQLGTRADTNQQEGVGVPSVAASRLGNRVVGFLSELTRSGPNSLVAGKFREASDIVDEAARQISILRGRLGAFERNTLRTNINQLQITMENLVASESTIRDTDFAEETSNLSRAQILVQAGTSVLAIANASSQSVLQLLQ